MSSDAPAPSSFGPNAWLVDEMYEQFLDDPQSVGESWREFFADYKRDRPTGPVPAVGTPTPTPPPAPAAPSRPCLLYTSPSPRD